MTAEPAGTLEVVAELLIDDVEQLKIMADPLRLRIVEILGETPIHTWTAKEVAERLGTKQTKLYHHLGLLEEHGFIRVAETRLVSGIVEKRYAVVAQSFRVERNLLAGAGAQDAVGKVLDAIFEKARNEILDGARAGLIDMSAGDGDAEPDRTAVKASHARLSPASVDKVMALIEELTSLDGLEEAEGTDYGLVIAFYPRATERTTTK
jgi:DNA-binding transcriptional ArsR family regulator